MPPIPSMIQWVWRARVHHTLRFVAGDRQLTEPVCAVLPLREVLDKALVAIFAQESRQDADRGVVTPV